MQINIDQIGMFAVVAVFAALMSSFVFTGMLGVGGLIACAVSAIFPGLDDAVRSRAGWETYSPTSARVRFDKQQIAAIGAEPVQHNAAQFLAGLPAPSAEVLAEVLYVPTFAMAHDASAIAADARIYLQHLQSGPNRLGRNRRERNFRVLDTAEACGHCGRIRRIFIGAGCVKCWAGPTLQ